MRNSRVFWNWFKIVYLYELLMQKSTLDSLLKTTNVSEKEANEFLTPEIPVVELNSLQTEPQTVYNEEFPEVPDDSITDIDIDTNSSEFNEDILQSLGDKIPASKSRFPGNGLSSILCGYKRNPDNEIPDKQALAMVQTNQDIAELEQRVHNPNNNKVPLKNILSYEHQKKLKPELKPEMPELKPDLKPEDPIVIDDTPGDKIFQNYKKVSARNILKPKKQPPPKLSSSYFVTLKVDSEALAFYKKFENPLKTRGNHQFYRSKKYMTTLKVNRDVLKGVQTKLDQTDTKSSSQTKKTNSIFNMMMQRASTDTVKMTPLQKLKELDPPIIKRDELHVTTNELLNHHNDIVSKFPQRSKHIPDLTFEQFQLHHDSQLSNKQITTNSYPILPYQLNELFQEQCDPQNPMFEHIQPLILSGNIKKDLLWPVLFAPLNVDSLFILEFNKRKLRVLFSNMFSRLKYQTYKGPRNELKKNQKKKSNNDPMAGFIINDDFYGQESDTDEEIFTPLLIIHGDTGTGKSSSVYTTMKELNGYVYEINAGQSRSRREISGTLKELCTTHLIHQQTEDTKFQKGIVLLEDCDLLFEQDRTFWVAVQEVLNISRIPIVLTCTDLDVIPKQLLECAIQEDAVLNLNDRVDNDIDLLKKYLWGCCFSQKFVLKDDLLMKIILESQSSLQSKPDIRKALLACQSICFKGDNPEWTITEVGLNNNNDTLTSNVNSLQEYADNCDCNSMLEAVSSGLVSQVNHDEISNEFIDIYYIDDSTKLKQPLSVHEDNVVDYLLQQKGTKPVDVNSKLLINELRNYTNAFIASRSKALPAYLRGLRYNRERSTRSGQEHFDFWKPDTIGIPENSISKYLSPTSFVLDFAPYGRYWNSFQHSLDRVETETLKNSGGSVKGFLEWREFQDKTDGIKSTFLQ